MFANINGYIVVFITEQVSFLGAYVGPALRVRLLVPCNKAEVANIVKLNSFQ